jgi:hypothetical protein
MIVKGCRQENAAFVDDVPGPEDKLREKATTSVRALPRACGE